MNLFKKFKDMFRRKEPVHRHYFYKISDHEWNCAGCDMKLDTRIMLDTLNRWKKEVYGLKEDPPKYYHEDTPEV